MLIVSLGCAHHVSKEATTGALEGLAQQVETEPGQRPMEAIASRAVEGALSHMEDPEQVARMRALVATLSREAGASATAAIDRQLESDLGNGAPLARTLGALATETTGVAAAQALRGFAPGCRDGDTACFDRRLTQLSEAAAAGFVRGVRGQLQPWALALAFLAGVLMTVGALLVRELLYLRRVRHERGPALTPQEHPA